MAGQGSARVTLKEIDLSQVSDQQQLPQGVPAAVVGPAKRGPAFVPKTFATIQQFNETFGSMLEQKRLSNSNLFAPLALNEWMKNSKSGTYIRVLGVGDGKKATNNKVETAGFKVGDYISHDNSNDLKLNEFIYTGTNTPVYTSTGRTYMLGSVMNDVAGSTYLSDAGIIQSSPTAATATITITDTVTADGEVIIRDTSGKEVVYTSKAAQNLAANQFIDGTAGVDDAAKAVLAANSLIAVINHASGHNGTITAAHNGSGVITLTQAVVGYLGNTLIYDGASNLEITTQFAGGTGGPMPIIRGVLMTPKGVVPSIDLDKTNNLHRLDNFTVYEETTFNKGVVSGANIIEFGSTPSTGLHGYEVGSITSNSFDLLLNGFKSDLDSSLLSCSFDPEDVNYFANVLNTDPTKIEEKGHYLYTHWDVDPRVVESISGISAFCMPGDDNASVQDFESFESRFRTAQSPWITSQLFGKGETVARGDTLSSGGSYKLFKLHSLDDGESGNTRFRILISNVRTSGDSKFGSFDLSLEAFDSDPIKGESLITWKGLNLDPDSRNYIARVIGDKHVFFNFDKPLSKQRLEETGDYEVKNNYVRVEMSNLVSQGDIPVNSLPVSFGGLKALNTKWGSGDKIFKEVTTDRDLPAIGTMLLPDNYFDNLMVLPAPFVKSVTRLSGTTKTADSSLPWGIKFGKKVNRDNEFKELSQIRLNDSVSSWTKYFPDLGSNKSIVEGDEADSFQNGYFSLEKIAIKEDSAGNVDWSDAVYSRDGSLPSGYTRFVQTTKDAVRQNVKHMKFRTIMQGGFDGVNIFNKEKAELTSVAAFREANDETTAVLAAATFTGPTVETYKRAIDVLSDKSATEFQLLVIPGIREPLITDYALSACETRFDAMFIMDILDVDLADAVILDSVSKSSVRNTINKFTSRGLDTSFAAAYYPDVFVRKPSNGSPVKVPPSVGMLGVMSQNDNLADPWFAPAGLNRGRLNATKSSVQMNRTLLDELYDADINPIYEPSGRSGEVYAFGQKTLLQNQSALDRINVRRLLINIRRRVKNIANTLLFEPNRESTLAKFSSLVEPIMAEVQARQGVDRYKVQIDTTTTTQNDVENNTIRGKIYLQPTKSVEFISLDFVVTNSID